MHGKRKQGMHNGLLRRGNSKIARSPSIVMDSFFAIPPLNTPPTDAAPVIWLHGSAKVPGSVNMEKKSTVNGAEEIESGARNGKFQQHELSAKIKRS